MTKSATSNSSYLAYFYLNYQLEPPRARGNWGKWIFVTPKFFQKMTDFIVKIFLISNLSSLLNPLSTNVFFTFDYRGGGGKTPPFKKLKYSKKLLLNGTKT